MVWVCITLCLKPRVIRNQTIIFSFCMNKQGMVSFHATAFLVHSLQGSVSMHKWCTFTYNSWCEILDQLIAHSEPLYWGGCDLKNTSDLNVVLDCQRIAQEEPWHIRVSWRRIRSSFFLHCINDTQFKRVKQGLGHLI